jgi:hypothetical protein
MGRRYNNEQQHPFREERHMKILLSILASAAVALSALASPPAQGAPEEKLDIAGVRIGMTEAEARAALVAFDPGLDISPVMAVFNYSDGVNQLNSPEFLDRLEGRLPGLGLVFKVYFSGPVGEVRVIGLRRAGLVMNNPPTAAQFIDSLLAKYGQPTGLSRGDKSQPVWEAAGKPSCIRVRDYKNDIVINLSPGMGEGLADTAAAEQFFAGRSGNNTGRGLIPADFTQCGAYLSYFFTGDPVRNFNAEVFDLGAMVSTERSRTAWVDQLEAEAVSKRKGQGATPRL